MRRWVSLHRSEGLNQPEYEYHGLLAESWDLLRGDTSEWPDGPFYREIILKDGEPALDVGCGTGRLLLDFLASGLDVDGVDVSLEMLDICRQKAGELGLDPTLYQQSMEHLDIPRKYRTIIVPSCSFQLRGYAPTKPAFGFGRHFGNIHYGHLRVQSVRVEVLS